MKDHYDFKKEWEKTKEQLVKFSQQATDLAKKGEEELVKFSRKGKLHIDSTAVSLKKEQLFYQIGKEYASLKDHTVRSPKLEQLLKELAKAEKEQTTLRRAIKVKQASKKRASKKKTPPSSAS